jgi:hypothetical protein
MLHVEFGCFSCGFVVLEGKNKRKDEREREAKRGEKERGKRGEEAESGSKSKGSREIEFKSKQTAE